jgi:diketogulonate reductase-like aldo/keto reductase
MGCIKSIGVSNFNQDQLSFLIKHAKIKPVLNQFQSYPGKHQQALIDFCKKMILSLKLINHLLS